MRLNPWAPDRYLPIELEQSDDLLWEASFRKRSNPIKRQALFCSALLSIGFAVGVATRLLNTHSALPLPGSRFSSAICKEPALRQEWRSLSTRERKNYIDAVKCLTSRPSVVRDNGTLYDDFPWVHMEFGKHSHESASFLSWHRYFIHLYETRLREDCGYEGHLTYWDWSLDSEDLTKSPVWDSETGFGGDGDPDGEETVGDGRCVVNGPFKGLHLLFYGEGDEPHCFSRGFFDGKEKGKLPGSSLSPHRIDEVLSKQDFESFFLALERGPHDIIANSVRGEFQQFYAPGDPVFFLHHTQLDRLWWLWQRRNPWQRQHAYTGRANRSTTVQGSPNDVLGVGGFAVDVQVGDILDTTGPLLCYTY